MKKPIDHTMRTVRFFNTGSMSLHDLIELDIPTNAIITSLHYNYERPETAEEHEQRMRFEYFSDERHSKWEQETYAKLYEKFKGAIPNSVKE